MGSLINDIQVGQDTRIDICSYSHGRKRVPMAQSLSFTPNKTVGVVGEFDNRSPVLVYETYEGVDVAFETNLADQVDTDAMIMDVDPNTPVIQMDHAQTKQVRVFCNYTGRNTGYIYAAEYAENLRVSSNPSTSTLKDPTKVPYTFKGSRHVKVEGKTGQKCSIQYNRFYKTTATFVTADDIAFAGQVGTFPKKPVTLPNAGGATTVDNLAVVKNGTKLASTAFTIDTVAGTITMTDTLNSGDIVETWTVTQE